MRMELMCTTATLLNEIKNLKLKRNDVAITYALAMKSSDDTDWKKVNAAIMERWSKSALIYIKERAWKIAEGKIKVQKES